MFELAYELRPARMSAYAEFQQREFASEPRGYTATRHQREGRAPATSTKSPKSSAAAASSTTALTGSTEEAQFTNGPATRNASARATVSEELVVAPPRMPIAARLDDRKPVRVDLIGHGGTALSLSDLMARRDALSPGRRRKKDESRSDERDLFCLNQCQLKKCSP